LLFAGNKNPSKLKQVWKDFYFWHGKAAHQTLFFLFGGLPLASGTI